MELPLELVKVEIIPLIARDGDYKSICAISQVCKTWESVCKQDSVALILKRINCARFGDRLRYIIMDSCLVLQVGGDYFIL